MPQNCTIVATKTVHANLNVFCTRNHPAMPVDNTCRPDLILQGHTRDGSAHRETDRWVERMAKFVLAM